MVEEPRPKSTAPQPNHQPAQVPRKVDVVQGAVNPLTIVIATRALLMPFRKMHAAPLQVVAREGWSRT
jgi:hypothetical protein